MRNAETVINSGVCDILNEQSDIFLGLSELN